MEREVIKMQMFKFMVPIIATMGIIFGVVKAFFLSIVSGKQIDPPHVVKSNFKKGVALGILLTLMLAAGAAVAYCLVKKKHCCCDDEDYSDCLCDDDCCATVDQFDDDDDTTDIAAEDENEG